MNRLSYQERLEVNSFLVNTDYTTDVMGMDGEVCVGTLPAINRFADAVKKLLEISGYDISKLTFMEPECFSTEVHINSVTLHDIEVLRNLLEKQQAVHRELTNINYLYLETSEAINTLEKVIRILSYQF